MRWSSKDWCRPQFLALRNRGFEPTAEVTRSRCMQRAVTDIEDRPSSALFLHHRKAGLSPFFRMLHRVRMTASGSVADTLLLCLWPRSTTSANGGLKPGTADDESQPRYRQAQSGRKLSVEILERGSESRSPVLRRGSACGRDGTEAIGVFLPSRRYIRCIECCHLFSEVDLEMLSDDLCQPA